MRGKRDWECYRSYCKSFRLANNHFGQMPIWSRIRARFSKCLRGLGLTTIHGVIVRTHAGAVGFGGSVGSYSGEGRIERCFGKKKYTFSLGWMSIYTIWIKEKGNNARKDYSEWPRAQAFERRVESDRCDAGSFTNPDMSDICFKAL